MHLHPPQNDIVIITAQVIERRYSEMTLVPLRPKVLDMEGYEGFAVLNNGIIVMIRGTNFSAYIGKRPVGLTAALLTAPVRTARVCSPTAVRSCLSCRRWMLRYERSRHLQEIGGVEQLHRRSSTWPCMPKRRDGFAGKLEANLCGFGFLRIGAG